MDKFLKREDVLLYACDAITEFIAKQLGTVEFLRVTTETGNMWGVGNGQFFHINYRNSSMDIFLRLYTAPSDGSVASSSVLPLDSSELYADYDGSEEAIETLKSRIYKHVEEWSGVAIKAHLKAANPTLDFGD